MRLSFVMPAYKRQYLAESIQSILRQTFTDFELIVVDDGSPENLEDVVVQFQDRRIRYIKNASNLGGTCLTAVWNTALGCAEGEWCVLASDDDVYMPEFAERMLALSAKHPQCDVLHCRIAVVDGDGMVMRIAEKRPEFESCADLLYARGVKRCLQTASEFMFRRVALQRQGGFVEFPLAWYSDDATWLSLAKAHGVACVSDVLFHWRYSGLNISSRFDIAPQKVAAAEAYKAWLHAFIPTVGSIDTSDAAVLAHVGGRIWCVVDQQTLCDLDEAKFGVWLKVLVRRRLSLRMKARMIHGRLLKICRLLFFR